MSGEGGNPQTEVKRQSLVSNFMSKQDEKIMDESVLNYLEMKDPKLSDQLRKGLAVRLLMFIFFRQLKMKVQNT
jgi:hypothetical protein